MTRRVDGPGARWMHRRVHDGTDRPGRRAGAFVLAAAAGTAVWADVAATGALARADAPLRQRAVALRSGWLVGASRAVTATGGAPGRALLAAAVLGPRLVRAGRRPVRGSAQGSARGSAHGRGVLPVALALALAPATSASLKRIVRRQRPSRAQAVITEDDPSFPSGHAAGSAALAVTLTAALGPTAALPTAAWSLTVGATRVHLGVHWPTDVLAGWCAGVGAALVALEVADRIDRVGRAAQRRPRGPARNW